MFNFFVKANSRSQSNVLLLNDPLHTLIRGKPFNNSLGQNLKSIKKQTLCENQKAFPVFDLNFFILAVSKWEWRNENFVGRYAKIRNSNRWLWII